MTTFITHLQSKELQTKLINLNIPITEIQTLIKDFDINYKERHTEDIDSLDSIIEAIYLSFKSGLSVRKDLGYSYLQFTKEKQNDVYQRVVKFMPMYKGLLYKVREAGFDIDCDYILYCEKDSFDCDFNTNIIKINTNKRFLLPVPSVPMFNYLNQQDLIKNIEKHDWVDYDIIGLYAIVKNTTTNKNIKVARYSLAEIVERCVVVEKDFNTKKNVKKIKNKFLLDYLSNKDMMLTNVIEALKIRVIRLICKTLNEDLAKITTLIDKAEEYIDIVEGDDVKCKDILTQEQTNTINLQQEEELLTLLQSCKSITLEKILNGFQVQTLKEIKESVFEKIKAKILIKIEKEQSIVN